ncbi:MAG: magnesium chelatase subunit H [Pseudomonadota bacterium]
MKRRRIMGGKAHNHTPIRVVLISLDRQLEAAVSRARDRLKRDLPGLELSFHAAVDWGRSETQLEDCRDAISKGDIVVASMLFLEEHINAVLPDLKARRDHCDAMVGALSATDIVKLTRLGRFNMDKPASGPIALLKRLRGSDNKAKAGASQARMLRRLPKLLKYVPGTAQDVRAYFLSLQYWLSGSDENLENFVRFLIDRYASGPRESFRGSLTVADPVLYPDVGVYHPRMAERVSDKISRLPLARSNRPTVGLLIMRSYVLSRDTRHYDGVIQSLETLGMKTIPAFASGLDAREAINAFFMKDGQPTVDAVVSLTGFSLVGGPAYNDASAASDVLESLNVPYISAQALEFQTLEEWETNPQGLSPIEATMMVAIPEIDGSTGPIVFGARSIDTERGKVRDGHTDDSKGFISMQSCPERAEMLARRVKRLIDLRHTPVADRRIAITLFNFPPNGGAAGTAAYLDVFASLNNTLRSLKAEGYTVDCPPTAEALRTAVLGEQMTSDARVHDLVDVDDHVRSEVRLSDIEAQWGPAPGRQQARGRSIEILGARLGNIFVGLQPAFGYEGDPMRLLFESGFAPTHAFAAYYRWLRESFQADAVLHFGTHGALEFMPGKQVGMGSDCWPDYLIDDLPNIYFYAANNPSEASIAKRRSAATTISYLTPPVVRAGLYKGFEDLRDSINRWRTTDQSDGQSRLTLLETIRAQAEALDLDVAHERDVDTMISGLMAALIELEESMIPHGLHVAGEGPNADERQELLAAMPPGDDGPALPDTVIEAIVNEGPQTANMLATDRSEAVHHLADVNDLLIRNREMEGLVRALDGQFIRPVTGGDLIRNPSILPTGRNIHGLDPCRVPTAFALRDGEAQALRLIDRHKSESGRVPESVAIVLWGTDNLKSEGAQLAQALALLGARPRFDSYGRLCGAELIPLAELGRPRIDVIVTLSGIFRDLLPLQSRLLAEAAFLAAAADEPEDRNFVRKHALAYQAEQGCDLETAALRVFSNAEGAYGSNVNQLIDAGCWNEEDELANVYSNRKCFAYGVKGEPTARPDLLHCILGDVDLAYQNLESVDLGLTTIDHYFDTLGGVSQAVKKARGETPPVYIGDQTTGDGLVRTLNEQVALESRTRALNPKWYEGMLRHGYEGVRQIEAHVTNTMGWSATTGQVEPWVYQRLGETYILDEEMRRKLAELNPKSSAKLAGRLLEACDRNYWTPDSETLEALRQAGDELEDQVEGININEGAAA